MQEWDTPAGRHPASGTRPLSHHTKLVPRSADWRPSSPSQHFSAGQGGCTKLWVWWSQGELRSLLPHCPLTRKFLSPLLVLLMPCGTPSPKKILACLFNQGKLVSGLGGAGGWGGGRGRCWPQLKEVKISEKSPFAPKKPIIVLISASSPPPRCSRAAGLSKLQFYSCRGKNS